ncbi:hypothetical protein ABZX12_03110 [Kribbella sp. NPDC003505]|uniref:hypothetical protein n=1 Tax=Kribbella sp. NPDC003505 TaxID=3154448 RepID=UPI0033BEB99A
MEFRADGTFVEYLIGRGDAPEAGPTGRWDTNGRLTRASGDLAHFTTTADRLDITWQH